MEVDHFSKVLQTRLVDATSDPALMLDFSCVIEGIPTINLTKDKAVLHYPQVKGNIADDPEDNLEVLTTAPGPSNHQQTVCDESFQSVAWKVPNSNQSIIENQTIMAHNLIVFFCVNYCVKVTKPMNIWLLYNITLFCSMFQMKERSLEASVVFLFNIKSCYVKVK